MSAIALIGYERNGKHRLLSILGRVLSRSIDVAEQEFNTFAALRPQSMLANSVQYAFWYHLKSRYIKKEPFPAYEQCTKHTELVILSEPTVPFVLLVNCC